jgi:hypothetical protein
LKREGFTPEGNEKGVSSNNPACFLDDRSIKDRKLQRECFAPAFALATLLKKTQKFKKGLGDVEKCLMT